MKIVDISPQKATAILKKIGMTTGEMQKCGCCGYSEVLLPKGGKLKHSKNVYCHGYYLMSYNGTMSDCAI